MVREDIFNIDFPQNDKLRMCLNMKRLAELLQKTQQFDKTAALVATRFKINSRIKEKIESTPDYLDTWIKTCTSMFVYLLGPAKFLERKDADELVCLPTAIKVDVCGRLQTIRGISIYNSSKRIGTLFLKDPEFNNEFAFFGQNGFSSIGSWVSKVRNDVQSFNLYGMTKLESSDGKKMESADAIKSVIESTSAIGNTITVVDIFTKIDELKNTYTGVA